MKKQIGLIVLAACALATLATAQVPVPPAPPAAPVPLAAPAPVAVATPVAAPNLVPAMPPPPPAPPAPPPVAVAAPTAPQAPAAPPKPARPAKTPEAAQAPEPARAPAPPEPPPPPPPGRERGEPDPVNIQFKVTVTVEGKTSSKRVAILTVSNGTGNAFSRGFFRSGNNVPVASTSLTTRSEDGKETPVEKPLTSYNYRSVGLNVDVEQAILVAASRVRASLSVEFSGVDERTGPGSSGVPPSFPTFSQRVSLYLESGKPVLVAQATDLATGVTQMVEVEAKVLR